MTLYNKDGTIYKLAKPNPLMHNQNLWSDQDDLKIKELENNIKQLKKQIKAKTTNLKP